jgi:hypothetical protein
MRGFLALGGLLQAAVLFAVITDSGHHVAAAQAPQKPAMTMEDGQPPCPEDSREPLNSRACPSSPWARHYDAMQGAMKEWRLTPCPSDPEIPLASPLCAKTRWAR